LVTFYEDDTLLFLLGTLLFFEYTYQGRKQYFCVLRDHIKKGEMTSSKVKHPLISRFRGAADANAVDMDRETGGPGGPLWAFYKTEN
jgi:hypothetical protein